MIEFHCYWSFESSPDNTHSQHLSHNSFTSNLVYTIYLMDIFFHILLSPQVLEESKQLYQTLINYQLESHSLTSLKCLSSYNFFESHRIFSHSSHLWYWVLHWRWIKKAFMESCNRNYSNDVNNSINGVLKGLISTNEIQYNSLSHSTVRG